MNNEQIESLFKKFAENRHQMKNFYQINLKPLQLAFVKTKEELDSYNPEVIKRLEKWLTDFSIQQSSQKDEELAGLNMENIDSANTIYSSYIKTEEKFITLEQQINKHSKQYNTFKDENTRLQDELLAKTSYLINDITSEYYSSIDYNSEEVTSNGRKALKEAFDTYKKNIPFTLMEYTEKIVKTHLKNYFKSNYNYQPTNHLNELTTAEYEYLLKKLISFLKTNQSIYKIYQLIKLNNRYYKDETINKVIADLKNIISIFSDNEFENNVRLVKNIYEISDNLTVFIWSNRESIASSLTNFYNNNNI